MDNMENSKVLNDEAIPLYYQLEISLRSRLSNGEFAPGDGFPAESVIGKDYGVSRMTVRQALSVLEKEGLIKRKRGRGTYVTEKVKHLWAPKLNGSLDDAIALGVADRYHVTLLSRDKVTPPQSAAAALGLQSFEGKVCRIRRVRLYKGHPLAYIVNHLPVDIDCKISDEDILTRRLLANLELRAGLKLAEGDQKVGASSAEPDVAKLLKIRTGDPLVHMERSIFDNTGRAVLFSMVLFRADRYWYRVKLKRTDQLDKIDWSLV